MSEESEDEQKKKEARSSGQGESGEQEPQQSEDTSQKKDQKSQVTVSQPATKAEQPKPQPEISPARSTSASSPTVGTPRSTSTPIGRPTVGTPVGRPPSTPVAPRPVGAPVAGTTATSSPRPSVGTPVGSPRPGSAPSSQTLPMKPTVPPSKSKESAAEISRRNFIRGLAAVGGIAVLASIIPPLFPYLQSTVGSETIKDQQIVVNPDVSPTVPLTPSAVTNGTTFIYPYTGNSNVDSDTFVQCVLIKVPQGITIPPNYAQYTATDSSGNTYIAFSRVCVHLWCLWGTEVNNNDTQVGGPVLGPCPCHGSTYVPGSAGADVYGHYPAAQNQVPGQAIAGPAYLQPFPNDQLPIIKIRIASDGSFHAYGRVGQIGYCQQC